MKSRLSERLTAGRAAFGECFHTFVFGAYPVLIVVGSTAGVMPLDAGVVVRTIAISLALTAALLVSVTPFIPDVSQRAAWLSFVFIAFNLYTVVGAYSTHPGLAIVYTMAAGAAAALVVRPRSRRRHTATALNLAAGVVLAVNAYTSTSAVRWHERWRPAADALIETVVASADAPRRDPQPDIYYVVLDGFGRQDVLHALYQLDLGPFVTMLESRGFTIPDVSRSNYAQTYLSLASSLNLSYLDPIASGMQDSGDRRPLGYLISNNALTRLARNQGYEVIAIGSNYSATQWLDNADRCLCEQYGFHEIEAAAINLTPLRALPLDRWTYGAHRRKIEEEFRHLQNPGGSTGPKLVFAHLISPHPPFVFGSDGRPRPHGTRLFSLMDGNHFPGSREEYVEGYRDQAQFVANRLLSAIDAILSRPGPSPVIVVQGDHGPGSMWNWNDVAKSDARERLGIFSAYRFPGNDGQGLAPNTSPVNGMRIMANRYLGTSLPILPDRSFASTWQRPFQLVPVPVDSGYALPSNSSP